jgi:hypothetical protein
MTTTTTVPILSIETWWTSMLNYYELCVFRIEYIMKQICIILLNKFKIQWHVNNYWKEATSTIYHMKIFCHIVLIVFKCCSDLTFYFNTVRRPLTTILNCTTWLPHLHVFFTNKLHIVQVPSVVQIVRNKTKWKQNTTMSEQFLNLIRKS